ncbi:Kinase-like protein [Mycena sanguinolenta]|uniref:Kinase-like protein n=1 Tax=Mycena sanguinolenta TaxID=230812 RepID=A0A8H6Z9E6_9AGAR|nr:Kinase-like protein [Mycena sanguinolenta]
MATSAETISSSRTTGTPAWRILGWQALLKMRGASTTGGALTSNHAGSPRWFAPELLLPSSFGCDRFVRTTTSDVYAFACVCIELHTGRPPFLDVSQDMEAMLKVVAGQRPSRPASMSDDLWDLVTVAWAQDFHQRPVMEKIVASMNALAEALPADPGVDLVDAFLHSQEQRTALLAQALSDSYLRDALSLCEQHICTSLLAVLHSLDAKRAVLLLEGDRAQAFLDAIQAVLDRGSLPSADDRSRARRLTIKLSEGCAQLPLSLFISGVTDHHEYPMFAGGLGDVYRASYNGTAVALKRIRSFQASADSPRSHLRFCREALVWQTLRHKYVLPFIGIDRETFSSFCMVSPWMQHGTILSYLSLSGHADVDKMLLQIAEGLAYLHSMNIVHGDLRGNNIFVSDDGNACLADFALAGVIEDTGSTTGGALASTAHRTGSVRWFAPELIDPTRYGCDRFVRATASDVYAFACVCLELHTGRPPFFDVLHDMVVMLKVIAGKRPFRPASMSDHLWDLVTTAWAQDFHDRPPMEKIVKLMRISEYSGGGPAYDAGGDGGGGGGGGGWGVGGDDGMDGGAEGGRGEGPTLTYQDATLMPGTPESMRISECSGGGPVYDAGGGGGGGGDNVMDSGAEGQREEEPTLTHQDATPAMPDTPESMRISEYSGGGPAYDAGGDGGGGGDNGMDGGAEGGRGEGPTLRHQDATPTVPETPEIGRRRSWWEAYGEEYQGLPQKVPRLARDDVYADSVVSGPE